MHARVCEGRMLLLGPEPLRETAGTHACEWVHMFFSPDECFSAKDHVLKTYSYPYFVLNKIVAALVRGEGRRVLIHFHAP